MQILQARNVYLYIILAKIGYHLNHIAHLCVYYFQIALRVQFTMGLSPSSSSSTTVYLRRCDIL